MRLPVDRPQHDESPQVARCEQRTPAETLKAVHEFLRFQIEEHRTGDPETVQK